MESAETKLINILKDLKQNYCVKGLKLEFEAEGATYKEAEISKKLADEAGLNFIVKIGGCEAVRDLYDAKKIKSSTIVAPMIETPYALEKYNRAISSIFSEEEINNTNFFIDIETITGFKNIDEIFSSERFKNINGIVFGRGDFVRSMGLNKEDVDSSKIFNTAKIISEKVQKLNKKFIVGGGVSPKSVQFFKNLLYLTAFETRKIIFNSEVLKSDNVCLGIIKALNFETEWLNFKKELNGNLNQKDKERIKILSEFCLGQI